MAYSPFVPLRVFSSYTMLEGAIEPKAIAKAARERGFPAIAICDRNGLYGAMAFGDACKAAGVQPIVGALLSVARPGQRLANGAPQIDWLALYAQDETGWLNLCHLVSRAHLELRFCRSRILVARLFRIAFWMVLWFRSFYPDCGT